MEKYNSMYLGICVNNADPEFRGRVQIFIPHIMPALFESWNAEGKDVQFSGPGDNLANGLSAEVVDQLKQILPWAEAALPVLGSCAPGNLTPSNFYDQTPVANPTQETATKSPSATKRVERTSVSGQPPATAAPHSVANPINQDPKSSSYGSIVDPVISNRKTSTEPTNTNASSSVDGVNIILHTDPNGPTFTHNINDMAKGTFSYPSAGAMLWVFFREGNPLFPVYFAASYGSNEWRSIYRREGDGPAPGMNPGDEQRPSIGGAIHTSPAGGLLWRHSRDEDPTKEVNLICLYGGDGSNIAMKDNFVQLYARKDKRDQADGNSRTWIGQNEERTVNGDSNIVVMGDIYYKHGNVSEAALKAVAEIKKLNLELLQPLLVPKTNGA
jgi:hypothetical protein